MPILQMRIFRPLTLEVHKCGIEQLRPVACSQLLKSAGNVITVLLKTATGGDFCL